MKIVVLAKVVPDTEDDRVLDLQTGLLDRSASERIPDEINERALEVALRYKDAAKDTEVQALCVGPADSTKPLRKLLSMGADAAVHVVDDAIAGSDAAATARIIAAALDDDVDLVIAGNESTDGRGGVVPAMVAELRGLPLLPSLDEVAVEASAVSGAVGVEGGTLHVSADLPAVVSVNEGAAEPRFPNFKGIMKAKKKPLQTVDLASLDLAEAGARTVAVSTAERPPRAAGRKVVDDGAAATELAEFLAAERLI